MPIVRKTSSEIPPITNERAAELHALANRPDSDIDLSDAPQLSEDAWQRAIPGRFFRPTKTQITIRVDSDVLHWIRQGGDGYQTRLNAILREAMVRDLQDPAVTEDTNA